MQESTSINYQSTSIFPVVEKYITDILKQVGEHHPETLRHLHAVHAHCYGLARHLGHEPAQSEAIAISGLLHDTGKMYIPRSILDAPRPLTLLEWELIHQHPENSKQHALQVGLPGKCADWILNHHERADGKGYPRGLIESDITDEVKIIIVADVWDATLAVRFYHRPITLQERMSIIVDLGFKNITEAFFDLLGANVLSKTLQKDVNLC